MLKKSIVILITLFFFTFCKTKKEATESTRPLTIEEKNAAANQKTQGTVSHKYAACGTVVIVKSAGTELILVPFPKISSDFDKEGLTIKFTYRKLRMPVPNGCESGTMSELKDIEKSN